MSDYDPHLQGSDAPPSGAVEGPTAADVQKARENAREANRLHDAANKLAERGRK